MQQAIAEFTTAIAGTFGDEGTLTGLWYRVMGGGLTPDQQRVLWEVCDLVRFYQVVTVEVPFEPGPG